MTACIYVCAYSDIQTKCQNCHFVWRSSHMRWVSLIWGSVNMVRVSFKNMIRVSFKKTITCDEWVFVQACSSFVLKLLTLVDVVLRKEMRCHVYSKLVYLCLLAWHIGLEWTLSYNLSGMTIVTNSFRFASVLQFKNRTLVVYFLPECTVMNVATNATNHPLVTS